MLNKCTFLLGIILTLLIILNPTSGKTNTSHSHSYPKSNSLSGSGHSSSRLSGAGSASLNNYGYPSNKPSNSGHSYPSSISSQSYAKPGYTTSYPKSSPGYPATGSQRSPSSSHSYPSSAGSQGKLSGANSGYTSHHQKSGSTHGSTTSGGVHSYPPSSNNHTYPSGGHLNTSRNSVNQGLTSTGSHSYPSSTVRTRYPPVPSGHIYPSNTSKLNTTNGKHSYPSSSSTRGHSYPSSTSRYPTHSNNLNPSSGKHSYSTSGSSHSNSSSSGNSHSSGKTHAYPNSGGGLSGGGHGHSAKHSINVYKNYHYKPPAKIVYIPRHGGPSINYPVYHGAPPKYVYQYKDSGSKYGTLLAGLALMNLGTLGVAGYAAHQSSHKNEAYTYKPHPNELCKFGIKKENGDYEEIKIDCQIISSFILQDTQGHSGNNSTFTFINNANGAQGQTVTSPVNSAYTMLPNGTLVDVADANAYISMTAQQNTGYNQYDILPNGTLVPKGVLPGIFGGLINVAPLKSAFDLKGAPVKVTSKTECFVMSYSPTWNVRKSVPCRLLQSYADSSIHTNSGTRNTPIFTLVAAILVAAIVYLY